jgi:hypothetical protein
MAAPDSVETRTGLDPWVSADMPAPPMPTGLRWLGVVGPGVIVLGISIGSGEFLLGPAAFLKHGLALLWVSLVAIFFQTILNTEVMRYVLATGEPVFTGFMRTRPSATGWAWFYAIIFVLQMGWPAWAAVSAGAIFYLFAKQLPAAADAGTVHAIGFVTYLVCVALLLLGRRIGRTLELLNWVMVVVTLGSFLLIALVFVPAKTWLAAVLGFSGFDATSGGFVFLPEDADLFLLGALVAYSGCGGMMNFALGNWARDKGYGMSQHAGYIPALIGGERVNLAHHGFKFTPDARSLGRWRGWWRIVHADQWGVFFIGALLGMALPALLYMTFLPAGTEIRGLGISAALAESVGQRAGPMLAGAIAILGVWLLFKTQLDTIEGMTRTITDILWSGSARVRGWRGGDVRAVYYTVLALVVTWGVIALGLAAPIMLLQISANIAGLVFVVASLHLLYVNTRLLPPALRPPLWRRIALVAMSVFYSFFVVLAASSFW